MDGICELWWQLRKFWTVKKKSFALDMPSCWRIFFAKQTKFCKVHAGLVGRLTTDIQDWSKFLFSVYLGNPKRLSVLLVVFNFTTLQYICRPRITAADKTRCLFETHKRKSGYNFVVYTIQKIPITSETLELSTSFCFTYILYKWFTVTVLSDFGNVVLDHFRVEAALE